MNHAEFGRYLSRQRELRGLSRAEISRVTKIPPALLEALEEGEVRKLPGRVFVLRYVRAYAEVIGLEPNDAVLRYEEVEPAPPEPEAARDGDEHARRRRWGRVALFFAALMVGVWLAWMLHVRWVLHR